MPTAKKKRRAAARKPPRRRLIWRLIRASIIPLSILVVVGLILASMSSMRIASRFEMREREAPTRMYGRALSLTEGLPLPADDLVNRLNRLGYRRVRKEPSVPGEYRVGRSSLMLFLRSFETPGQSFEATVVKVKHHKDEIASVRHAGSDRIIPEAYLEPEVLATLYGDHAEDRVVLPLAAFPEHLVDAVLLAEDKHFYSHPGIDPAGIARATWANIKSRSIRQGGSTLTQQLAKNLFFEQERTWSRKIGEAYVSVLLEFRYSKDRILQAYLNEVYMGQKGSVSIHGFAQAARFYFGKEVGQLNLAQAATLAGLIRAPGRYNPFLHPERATERRNQVLDAMADEERISPEQRAEAASRVMRVVRTPGPAVRSRGISYLADYVRQMIGDDAVGDLSRAGMRVYTTVDPTLQKQAEQSLKRGLERLEVAYPRLLRRAKASEKLQGAMVVLDPADGSVLAMVGGRDYATSQFNRVTQARRQPGSLFKPFVYLAGWGSDVLYPSSVLMDEPIEMTVAGEIWAPANYDHEYRGPVTAQNALELSLNVPTVRASQIVGLDAIVKTASRAGIETPLKEYPSLALGAQEVKPLEIASAYAAIANGGNRVTPALVESIQDGRGVTTVSRSRGTRSVLSEQATFLITVALQGALDRGTGKTARRLGFTGTAAGKTGTTDDFRDAWFVGYTPDLLALVWVGFDDGDTTGLSGARAALPIWVDFMERAGAESTGAFPEPDGITWEEVDPTSGMLARWSCPKQTWMAFTEGTEPSERCNQHGWFKGWRKRRTASLE